MSDTELLLWFLDILNSPLLEAIANGYASWKVGTVIGEWMA